MRLAGSAGLHRKIMADLSSVVMERTVYARLVVGRGIPSCHGVRQQGCNCLGSEGFGYICIEAVVGVSGVNVPVASCISMCK